MRNPQVGDLNGDGILDIIFSESTYNYWYGSQLFYALGTGNGSLGSIQAFSGFYMNQEVADKNEFVYRPSAILHDFNGDGLVDILASGADKVSGTKQGNPLSAIIFYNQGTSTNFSFSNSATSTVKDVKGNELNFVNTTYSYADMDNDGIKDLIGCVGKPSKVYIWKNSGVDNQPIFEEPVDIGFLPYEEALYNQHFIGIADIDGDGDRDILSTGFYSPLYWYENLADKTSNNIKSTISRTEKIVNVSVSNKSILVTLEKDIKSIVNCDIIDVKGRCVYSIKKYGSKIKLDFNLISGQYLLRVSNSFIDISTRFVIIE